MLAHTVLYSEATRNIDAEFSSEAVRSATEKPKYQFKRSKSYIRANRMALLCVCVVHLSNALAEHISIIIIWYFRWKPESAV